MSEWNASAEHELATPGPIRPRRLRNTAAMRELVAETTVLARQLVMPHFVLPASKANEPISSMPGISRTGVDDLLRAVEADHKLGIKSVLLVRHAAGWCEKLDRQQRERLAGRCAARRSGTARRVRRRSRDHDRRVPLCLHGPRPLRRCWSTAPSTTIVRSSRLPRWRSLTPKRVQILSRPRT